MTLFLHAKSQQCGAVLMVSLFILVLLMIIGVSGMKLSSLQEKMAGNDRFEMVSFQAAETALRMGEAQAKLLYDSHKLGAFCNSTLNTSAAEQGLFSSPALSDNVNCPVKCPTSPTNDCLIPNPFNLATWDDNANNTQSVAVSLGSDKDKTTQARYYITYHYYGVPSATQNTFSNVFTMNKTYSFIITARGKSAKGSEVILRSYFGGIQ